MKEKDFQSLFTKTIKQVAKSKYGFSYLYKKIPDTGFDKKWYDNHIFLPKGRYIAFELKQEKKSLSFNFDKLEQHQDFFLNLQIELGNEAYVVIDWYNSKNLGRNKHKYFFIPYKEYLNIKKDSGTSIKFLKLSELGYEYGIEAFFERIL